jgi:hypothetical protein
MLVVMKKGIIIIVFFFAKFSIFLSAKEVMKIIRKRLHINPSTNGWRSIELTLTVYLF